MERADETPSRSGLRVSIIIVNYYSAKYLQRCLQCLSLQSFKPQRVLIINNGERDGELDFVKNEHPTYEMINLDNIGFAAANNLAVQLLVESEWVGLLNPDAFPDQNWLANLVAAAQRIPRASVFSAQLLNAGVVDRIDGEGDGYHFSGWAGRINHNRSLKDALRNVRLFSACAAAAIYRRSALIEASGFDENYFCYFEDVDLGFRLRLRGYDVVHVPDAVVHHIGGASSKSLGSSDFAIYHGHRNLVWTYVKNMPGYLFWLFLPAHLLMNIFAILFFVSKGKARVILRAKKDAVKQLPRVWAQRCEIQRARTVRPSSILKYLSFGVIR